MYLPKLFLLYSPLNPACNLGSAAAVTGLWFDFLLCFVDKSLVFLLFVASGEKERFCFTCRWLLRRVQTARVFTAWNTLHKHTSFFTVDNYKFCLNQFKTFFTTYWFFPFPKACLRVIYILLSGNIKENIGHK